MSVRRQHIPYLRAVAQLILTHVEMPLDMKHLVLKGSRVQTEDEQDAFDEMCEKKQKVLGIKSILAIDSEDPLSWRIMAAVYLADSVEQSGVREVTSYIVQCGVPEDAITALNFVMGYVDA